MYRAFTLIELLIVVAIIAVLAAIAVPNMLEAQTRSKTSRCLADIRTTITAIEAYAVDNNAYPLYGVLNTNGTMQNPHLAPSGAPLHKFLNERLTSPVAYMTALAEDVFLPTGEPPREDWRSYYRRYFYTNFPQFSAAMQPSPPPVIAQKQAQYGPWVLAAAGPDGDRLDLAGDLVYDPTNGTISDGDIIVPSKR